MKLSQKEVAELLDLPSADLLSRYERGASLPPLERALALEIAYRIPVAFLFPALYEAIRTRIRTREEELKKVITQPTLF